VSKRRRNPIQERFEALCIKAQDDLLSDNLSKREEGLSLGQLIYRRAAKEGFVVIVSGDTLLSWNGGGDLERGSRR
jgi:hypothetical protein